MDAALPAITMKALDSLSLRAAVTAENIANAGTPGYRPRRVSFEDALKAAAGQGPASIAAVNPTITSTPRLEGQLGPRLDQELATASATTDRYGALVEILNRELQIDALAVTGNS